MLRYTTDRARPGLVAVYDINQSINPAGCLRYYCVNVLYIRPGNGAGLFLQPRSPHRALRVFSITTADTPHLSEIISMLRSLGTVHYRHEGCQGRQQLKCHLHITRTTQQCTVWTGCNKVSTSLLSMKTCKPRSSADADKPRNATQC